jgi:hypothetical protein
MSDKDQAMTLAERISELATSSAMTWHEAFNMVIGAAGLLDAARERDRLRAAVDAALALAHTLIGNRVPNEIAIGGELLRILGQPDESIPRLGDGEGDPNV